MKKLYFIAAIVVLILSFSCEKDEEKPLVLSTEDVTLEVTTNVMEGDTVGIVPGTSNRGTITYAIASQTPEGAFRIGDTYGELIVANASLFDPSINPTISLVVNVSKEELNKTANVTINVLEGGSCPDVDLSPWEVDLVFEEDGIPTVEGTGIAGECGELTLKGVDFIFFLCENETETRISLIPSESDATVGTVVMGKQAFPCSRADGFEIEGTGSYDSNTGVIIIDYEVTGPDSFTGIKTVKPAGGDGGDGDDTDGDGALDADDSDPEDPCLPAQEAGYTGYDSDNDIWDAADCDGDGILNGDEVIDGTDPYEEEAVGDQTDTDGDGVIDTDDGAPEDPCLPAQTAGYDGYDAENATWAAADCDGDGTINGDEVTNDTDPYADGTDDGECESTVDTTVWNGDLTVTEDQGADDPLLGDAIGEAGCGTLVLGGDFLVFGCDGGTPAITFTLMPESAGATNGSIVAERQDYDCFGDDSIGYEATGTYDEATGIISLDFTLYEPDVEPLTGVQTITVK